MFGIGEVESKDNTQKERTFVGYGINKNVYITNVTGDAPEGKSPYLEISLNLSNNDENSKKLRLYYSDGAKKSSNLKLAHMANILGIRDQVDAADEASANITQWGMKLGIIMKGKMFKHFKLGADEYINANGETKVRVNLPFPAFCDVSEETKLSFDKNSIYDYRKIQKGTPETELTGDKKTNDLPF